MDTVQHPYFLTLTIKSTLNQLSVKDQHYFCDKEVLKVLSILDTSFAVTELTSSGNIHYHILFNSGFAYDSLQSQIRKVARRCPHLGYITKLEAVYDLDGLLDYMTKSIHTILFHNPQIVRDNLDGTYTIIYKKVNIETV